MHALIDGDLITYPISAACKDAPLSICLWRCESLIEKILTDVNADSFEIFLTGDKAESNNFRYTIDPSYKATRKAERPAHLKEARGFLKDNWDATITIGYEADDALGMNQKEDTIICTLDKDMRQIPGKHYNWNKEVIDIVTPECGIKHFFASSLIGDTADNITGVTGIGPVKAAKHLDKVISNQYYSVCRELYKDDERYHRNLSLLWIWRKMNDQGGWKSCVGGMV